MEAENHTCLDSGPAGGFTLLELLISLSIVGLIVVMVFGAFRVGAGAWEKGEEDVEGRQRQRIVLDLLKRRLASIYLLEEAADVPPFLIRGDGKSLEFLSRLPVASDSRYAAVYVNYLIKQAPEGRGEMLLFHENGIIFADGNSGITAPEQDLFVELIPWAESIGFEYLKEDPDTGIMTWQQAWDSASDEGLLRAVKIGLKEDSVPVSVIARLEPGR